jgi:hypothetical protein
MIQQAFATIHAGTQGCDDGLFASFAKVHIADSTGFELPESLKDSFPGSGGSAATAGAKIQAVWDYKSSTFAHFGLLATFGDVRGTHGTQPSVVCTTSTHRTW